MPDSSRRFCQSQIKLQTNNFFAQIHIGKEQSNYFVLSVEIKPKLIIIELQMKALFLLGLILFAANSYTIWDNWHNVPTTFIPNPWNATSVVSTLSGWIRNTPAVENTWEHWPYFSDYSKVFNQYMYFNEQSPQSLIFCGAKYYLYNQTACKKDPYYWGPAANTYCIPNYFNSPEHEDWCTNSHPMISHYPCCYSNRVDIQPPFQKDFDSVDPYTTPLW